MKVKFYVETDKKDSRVEEIVEVEDVDNLTDEDLDDALASAWREWVDENIDGGWDYIEQTRHD